MACRHGVDAMQRTVTPRAPLLACLHVLVMWRTERATPVSGSCVGYRLCAVKVLPSQIHPQSAVHLTLNLSRCNMLHADCYMVCGGLFTADPSTGTKVLGGVDEGHADSVLAFARDALRAAAAWRDPLGRCVSVRMGVHRWGCHGCAAVAHSFCEISQYAHANECTQPACFAIHWCAQCVLRVRTHRIVSALFFTLSHV